MMEGIFVVHKPQGMTSHDVVAVVRRKLKMKRVGHAGTLDPLATGVLVILVGKATKLFNKFVAFDKAYRATFVLGTRTNSADTEGEIIEQRPFHMISRYDVEKVFAGFMGEQKQIPPMVSAVKQKGRKLYELARKGIDVERQSRDIRIDRLEIIRFEPPEVEFYVECSKGTYIRQLADDVGQRLGCGACICQIERTKVGPYTIDQAIDLDAIHESHLRNWQG